MAARSSETLSKGFQCLKALCEKSSNENTRNKNTKYQK